jgi:hypothetical protein
MASALTHHLRLDSVHDELYLRVEARPARRSAARERPGRRARPLALRLRPIVLRQLLPLAPSSALPVRCAGVAGRRRATAGGSVSDDRHLKDEPALDAQPRCRRSHLKDHRKHWIGSERIEAPPGAVGAIRCMFGDEIAFYPVPGSGDSDDGLLALFFAPWPDPDSDRPAGWCDLPAPSGNPAQRAGVRQQTGPLFGRRR